MAESGPVPINFIAMLDVAAGVAHTLLYSNPIYSNMLYDAILYYIIAWDK